MSETLTLDQAGVLEVLPHREPFLFVHGVSELVPGKSGRGFVTIPADHPYTLGQPHVPAGLIIEAMAQLGGIAVLYERRDENLVVLFRSVNRLSSWKGRWTSASVSTSSPKSAAFGDGSPKFKPRPAPRVSR